MTYPSLRTPLRPLSRILPARERGENTDVIERENIRARHEAEKEAVRQRAQGRLLVLGIVFICLYSVIAIRVGTLSSTEPVEPRAQNAGASLSRSVQISSIARGASWRPIWKPIRSMLKPPI